MLRTGARKRGMSLVDDAERLVDRLEGEGLANPDLHYQRALVLALRGQHDAAAAALQRAAASGWRSRWEARRDPALADLRERNLPAVQL